MAWVQALGLALMVPANLAASFFGYKTRRIPERDLLLPLCAMAFTFYPLIVSLPEAHFKLINNAAMSNNGAINEDELFPLAFLVCLLAVTLSTLIDRFVIKGEAGEADTQEEEDQSARFNRIGNPKALKILLSASIFLQNLVNYYFISIETSKGQTAKQIFLYGLFSVLINYAHSYLLGLAGLEFADLRNFCLFVNSGLVLGWILGFLLSPNVFILSLLCVAAGMQLYCSVFICFPHIFSNGSKPAQDRTRYCSILIGFLLTVLYYPICYLLRI